MCFFVVVVLISIAQSSYLNKRKSDIRRKNDVAIKSHINGIWSRIGKRSDQENPVENFYKMFKRKQNGNSRYVLDWNRLYDGDNHYEIGDYYE